MVDILLFTDNRGSLRTHLRPYGAYRVASACRSNGFTAEVIDHSSFLSVRDMLTIIDKYCTQDTLAIGWATNYYGENDIFYSRKLSYGPDKDNRNLGHFYKKNDEMSLVKQIRRKFPNLKIIVGGMNAPYFDQFYDVDYYVNGYADVSVVELLKALRAKDTSNLKIRLINNNHKFIDSNGDYPVLDIDSIGTVWDHREQLSEHEFIPIEPARGCIFKCKFCSYPFVGKKKFDYIRSEESMFEEMNNLIVDHNITKFALMDDTFNDSMQKLNMMHNITKRLPKQIEYLCYSRIDLLIRFPKMLDIMIDMGLKGIVFGIESFNAKAAKSIGKGGSRDKVKDQLLEFKNKYPHVKIQANFIVGLPYDNSDMIYESAEWLIDTGAVHHWNFIPLNIRQKVDYYQYINLSPFERYPEKYGYNTTPGSLSGMDWSKDDGTDIRTFSDAKIIANELMAESAKYSIPGGWQYGLFASLGPTVEPNLDLPYGDMDLNLNMNAKLDIMTKYFKSKAGFIPGIIPQIRKMMKDFIDDQNINQ